MSRPPDARDPSFEDAPPATREPAPSELDHAVEVARALVHVIDGTSVSRLSISAGAIRIEVQRSEPHPPAETVVVTSAHNGSCPEAAPEAIAATAPAAVPPAAPVVPSMPEARVSAPLVGVFYRRSEPGKPPMVEVGERVEAGQPLAIVEAMKLMNEVVADAGGTVTGIHAEDQDVVEFGQLLFTIQLAD